MDGSVARSNKRKGAVETIIIWEELVYLVARIFNVPQRTIV
jgi:hypothetical protein